MEKKERLANIELLRILSILMIVLMHGVGCAMNSNNEVNKISFVLINAFCNMGVTVFVVISGYFGIRFKVSSAVRLWLLLCIYSVIINSYKVYSGNACLSVDLIVKTITPISSNAWWFMTCYAVTFCLSPFLNMIICHLSQRRASSLLAVLVLFFVIFPTFLHHSITNDYGKGLPNFLLAYLVGQYIKKYSLPQYFVRHSGIIYLLCGLFVFFINYIVNSPLLFSKDNNLFIIVGAVALFVWMTKHPFKSVPVNYLASYAFPLYLQNAALLLIFLPTYKTCLNSDCFLPYFFIAQIKIILSAFAIEFVRRILTDRGVRCLSEWCGKTSERCVRRYF